MLQNVLYRDRGGGGAGRAIALPLFCWDLFSRAPVDIEKVIVELLDFSLKGGRLEPVVFDKSLRTMQFLWKSGMFACPNDYNPMLVCILEGGFIPTPIIYLRILRVPRWLLSVDKA